MNSVNTKAATTAEWRRRLLLEDEGNARRAARDGGGYATDPRRGVHFAAEAKGLDTDTVASMTGALLAAINGSEWLGDEIAGLQDADYIRRVASQIWAILESKSWKTSRMVEDRQWKPAVIDVDRFSAAEPGDKIEHDVFGTAVINSSADLAGPAGVIEMRAINVTAFGGQTITLYARTYRTKPEVKLATQPKIGVRFYARDLKMVREFYEKVLGLTPTAESPSLLRYGPNIVFAEARSSESGSLFGYGPTGQSLVIEVVDLDRVFARLREFGIRLEENTHFSNRQMAFFRDPEGRRIEVFAAKKGV